MRIFGQSFIIVTLLLSEIIGNENRPKNAKLKLKYLRKKLKKKKKKKNGAHSFGYLSICNEKNLEQEPP